MWAHYTNRITLTRLTDRVVEPSAAGATLSLARQPARASLLEARVTGGSENTGEVTVQGLVAGVTTTEVLTFTGAGYKRTLNSYSSIVAITTSGLADEATVPTVKVSLKGHDNSPVQVESTVVSDYPAAVDESATAWPAHPGGGRFQEGKPFIVIPYAETFEPRPGDRITDDLARVWEVEAATNNGGTVLSGRQWHLRVKRWEHAP